MLLFFGDWFIKTVLALIEIVCFVAPARRLPWKLLSPGGLIATLACVLGSRVFVVYVDQMARYQTYQKLYGSLAALIFLMLWFYISSSFLLIGGEINSEVHRVRRGEEPRKKTSPN